MIHAFLNAGPGMIVCCLCIGILYAHARTCP